MKKNRIIYFNFLFALSFLAYSNFSMAQDAKPRKSPKATVSQTIGVDTEIVIDYGRPAVKGRTIWGDLVPYGTYPGNEYSKEKRFPWRAGANENTTIEFNHDLMIEGKKIAAGKYSIHMIASASEFKVMFNTVNDAWGSYTYDASKNALEISVKPIKTDNTEWLEYGFENLSESGATAYLKWEKFEIPMKIELAK